MDPQDVIQTVEECIEIMQEKLGPFAFGIFMDDLEDLLKKYR